jgi:hypothetical protein
MIRTEKMDFVNRTVLDSMTPDRSCGDADTVRVGRTMFATALVGDAPQGRSVVVCDFGDDSHSRASVKSESATFADRSKRGHV